MKQLAGVFFSHVTSCYDTSNTRRSIPHKDSTTVNDSALLCSATYNSFQLDKKRKTTSPVPNADAPKTVRDATAVQPNCLPLTHIGPSHGRRCRTRPVSGQIPGMGGTSGRRRGLPRPSSSRGLLKLPTIQTSTRQTVYGTASTRFAGGLAVSSQYYFCRYVDFSPPDSSMHVLNR